MGMSGGLDSSVVAKLAAGAVGPRRVLGVSLPLRSGQTGDEEDARRWAARLRISFRTVEVGDIVEAAIRALGTPRKDAVGIGNIQARARMIALYQIAHEDGRLVLGTGNKSELLTGYFCYDETSRAVTVDGPKHYTELEPEDTLLSLDLASGKVVERSIGALHHFDYSGEMIRIQGEGLDLVVTPNHRVLVSEDGDVPFTFVRADALSFRGPVMIPSESAGLIQAAPRYMKRVPYHGKVWCPSVPPHQNFLVERRGRMAFCGNTKFGDGGCDFLPVGDLYKTQVRELGISLEVPEAIVLKVPSAGLWEGQTDEAELGISYDDLDQVLLGLELEMSPEEIASRSGLPEPVVGTVSEMVRRSIHKRKMPLIPKIGVRTLGLDWRE